MELPALCHDLRKCESAARVFALYKRNEQLREDRFRYLSHWSLCATGCVRPIMPISCEMRHCFSQSGDSPRAGLSFGSAGFMCSPSHILYGFHLNHRYEAGYRPPFA
jgi:hypothetical protein